MKKLYNEFFYIPQHGKIREKVMITHVCVIVCTILCSLAAMSFTAYAYFTSDVRSEVNKITSAVFDVDIAIVKVVEEESVGITENNADNIRNFNLPAGTYQITITPSEASTASTGYVVLKTTKADGTIYEYHTQQLGKDGAGNTESIVFYITADDTVLLSFEPNWGTSVYYNDIENEHYIRKEQEIEL